MMHADGGGRQRAAREGVPSPRRCLCGGEPAVTHTAAVPAGRLAGSDKKAAGLAADGEATGRGTAVATGGDKRHGGGADQTSQLALVGAHRALCPTRGEAREVQQGPRSYSRSPKNPTLQLLQKSSKSASTTPQRPIWNTFGTVAVRDFWESGCILSKSLIRCI